MYMNLVYGGDMYSVNVHSKQKHHGQVGDESKESLFDWFSHPNSHVFL